MAERVIARYSADRAAYIRAHLVMTASFAGIVAIALWAMGNPHIWVAFVAAPLAIGIRGLYLAPEEFAAVWELTDRSLTGPSGRRVRLSDITRVRRLGSAAQVITRDGQKHLLKYLADPDAVVAEIEWATAP